MRLASFFCGAGGFDLGFRSAGFTLAFASDYYPRAAETFTANLGHAPKLGDIRDVVADDIPEGIDVVTGGFPCVTFSTAGRRAGLVDDINGKLYLELCRMIETIKPRYFVAENVRGMLSANGGKAIKLVLAAFLRLGYRTGYELVNMAEHGVPQTRERVIFVGVRLDQWRGSFVFPKKTHRLLNDKKASAWLSPARSLRVAIGDLGSPSKKLIGATGGENGYNIKARSEGRRMTNRDAHAIRGADLPSEVPTSTHAPHVLIQHDLSETDGLPVEEELIAQVIGDAVQGPPNDLSKKKHTQYNHGRSVRSVDEPSTPMVASVGGAVVVQGHEENALPPYPRYSVASKTAEAHLPAPTMSTPPQNAPFIMQHEENNAPVTASKDGFKTLYQGKIFAPGEKPSPTIVATAANVVPFVRESEQTQHEENPHGARKFNTANRLARDEKPSPTVTSGGEVPGSDAPFIVAGADGEKKVTAGTIRRMTVRECARVQTFPDWYEFKGSQADGYRQIGNAVPPLYARRLAEAIIKYDDRKIIP
jgi:DNA (cytosine-5)-methyltransferase 1